MKEVLKILIVDDEPEARELLNFILREEEGLKVVGMAGNVDDALEIFRDHSPHLVFLDIQMPEKDGFHFIKQINPVESRTGVVFVTAFENYAIQAIRNSVFDYILKPVSREDLLSAIARFRERPPGKDVLDLDYLVESLRNSVTGKVKLNTRSGYILINPADVVYCKADGNYTHIMLANGTEEVTTQNLGAIEELLKSATFFRASRSYLINLRYVSRVDRKSGHCTLEYSGRSCSIKIPSTKLRMLEANFS